VKVKEESQVKEDYDFTEMVETIPAAEAFREPTDCDMG
jgi:hypothetical protein